MLKLLRTGGTGRNRPLPPTPQTTAPPGAGLRKAWRSGVLAAALGLLSTGSALAQASGYSFAQSTGTYSAISGGTVLGVDTNDDTSFPALPIGFSFVYNGTTYTTFSVNSNGFLALGGSASSSYTAISSGTSNNIVAALNLDLQGNTTTGNLQYLTTGSSPTRVLTVQWTSYRNFGGTGQNYNFQIKLYEGSNNVEMVYGAFTVPASITPQIGLRGSSNSDYNNRRNNTASPTPNNTLRGTANSNTVTFSSTQLPTSGLTFTYSPPSCSNPAITTVTPSVTSASVAYSAASPVPSGGYEYRFKLTSAMTFGAWLPVGSNPFSISSLTADTQYDVQLRSNCGGGTYSGGTATTTFRTLCNPIGAPFTQTFQSVTTPALPACWSPILINSGGSARVRTLLDGATNIVAELYNSFTADPNGRVILISPPLSDLGVGKQVRFRARTTSTSGTVTLRVGEVTSTAPTATFTNLNTPLPLTTTYQDFTVDLSGASQQYFAFRHGQDVNGGTGTTIYIDNVIYEDIPACQPPSNLNSGTTTQTTAGITFTPNGSNPTEVFYQAAGGPAPTGATTPQVTGVTGTSYTITGLTADTQYDVYIRSNCGTTSAWTGPLTITTQPGPLAFDIDRFTGITYTSIASTGTAVPFAGTGTDDQVSNDIPFTFTYNPTGTSAVNVTNVRVSTNGNIQLRGAAFGTNSTTFTSSDFATTGLQYTLAPFFEDLNQTSQAVGVTHKYLITGTSPSRVLTVEWVNTARFGNPGVSLNFQVKIYEATGVIEYIYGAMTAYNGTTSAPAYAYVLGLKGDGAANRLAVQQVANTDYFLNQLATLNLTPACNSMIRFTPGTYSNTPPPAPTAPANDDLANAQAIPFNQISTPATQYCDYYVTTLANATSGLPSCGTSNADDDVWFSTTTPTGGSYTTQVRVGASNGFTPTVQVFQLTNPMGPVATSNLTQVTGACATGSSSQAVSVMFAAAANTTYYIRVNHSGTGTGGYGQFVVDAFGLPPAPGNDVCSTPTAIGSVAATCPTTPLTGTTFGATNSNITTTCGGTPTNDVFYSFSTPTTAVAIDVTGQGTMAPSFEVLTACTSPTSLGCFSTTTAGGTASGNYFGLTPSTTYLVRVYGGIGGFEICVRSLNPLPNDSPNGLIGTAYDLTPTVNTCSSVTGTTVGAFGPYTGSQTWTSSPDDDVYYTFLAGAPKTSITVAPTSSTFPTIVEAFASLPPAGTSTAISFASGAAGVPATLTLTGLTVNQRYWFRVFSSGTTERSAFSVCVTSLIPPANDNPAAAGTLTSATTCTTPVAGSTIEATNTTGTGLNPAPRNGGTVTSANDVWYQFTTTGTSSVRAVTVTPSGINSATFDPVFQVGTWNAMSSTFTPLTITGTLNYADANGASLAETATLTLPAGTYYVRVYNSTVSGTTDGGFNICLTQGTKAPSGIAAVQVTGPVYAGSTKNAILRLGITVSGAGGTLPFSAATFQMANTNNADVSAVRIYRSTDATFTSADPLIGTGNVVGNSVSFTNLSSNLPVGTTYFFLTYDVAAGATVGNTLDAQILANSLTIGAATYPASALNPAGTRAIVPPLPANDEICGALTLSVPTQYAPVTYQTFSNVSATTNSTPTACASFNSDVWFRADVPANRTLYIETLTGLTSPAGGTNGDVVLQVFSSDNNNCSGNLTQLACDDDNGVASNSSVAVISIPAGVSRVYIRVGGFGTTATGNFRLGISDRPKFLGGTTAFNPPAVFGAASSNFFPQADDQYFSTQGDGLNIVIPTGLTAVATGSPEFVYGVTIAPGATLTLSANSTLTVGDGGLEVPAGATLTQDPTSTIFVDGDNPVAIGGMMFQNLRVGTNGAIMTGNVDVRRVVRVEGSLNTNGRRLRLLSDATGTALVWADGGSIAGPYTAQRYIDGMFSSTPKVYRHMSAPVTTTLNDMRTPGVRIITNTAYNSFRRVSPFPTVFGYDESRIATARPNFYDGYFSPNAPTDPMGNAGNEMRGYTVMMPDGVTPDFTGTTHTGPYSSGPLSKGAFANSGWHLLGNPYPSPIDWSTVTNAQISNMNGTIYIARSIDSLNGNYLTWTNGVGSARYVPMAQGFFMFNPSAAGVNGSVSLNNNNRVTAFVAASNVHYRTAGETRPLVKLTVQQVGRPVEQGDETYVYFQQGATTGMDDFFDGYKLHSMGNTPSLYTKVGTADAVINGLPALGTDEVIVPLGLKVGITGSYKLNVADFLNIPATVPVVLRDAVTGTEQDLVANPTYAFTMDANYVGVRFQLVFNPANRVLGTSAALAANQVSVFPNPTPTNAKLHVEMTGLNTTVKSVTATLVDALGRTVSTEQLAAVNGEVNSAMSTRSLSKGVYTLRLTAGAQTATRRVVIE